jgi:hypothetical protein
MKTAMKTIWRYLKMAGVVIGPILFFGSLVLNARDIVALNLAPIWWQIIGGVLFVVSVSAIIWGQHRENVALKKEAGVRAESSASNGVVVLKEPPMLFIKIQDVDFALSGDSGFPRQDSSGHKAKWIRLGMLFKSNVYVETLELVISGKQPIPAFEWKPNKAAYYFYFQIPTWVKSGEERTIQVTAFANGKKWGSEECLVDFPM